MIHHPTAISQLASPCKSGRFIRAFQYTGLRDHLFVTYRMCSAYCSKIKAKHSTVEEVGD